MKPKTVFNFVVNDKGGVGKSPTAINLAAYVKSRDRPCRVVDADLRATSLKRTFPDTLVLAVSELEVVEGTSQLGELLPIARAGGTTVVVDTGASVRPILAAFFDMVGFAGLTNSLPLQVNMIIPIDHTQESRVFATQIQNQWPWATHWHVHIRSRQAYDRAKFPAHPEDRVIEFPYLPESMRVEMQTAAVSLDQAISRGLFKEFMQREILEAARAKLYGQFHAHEAELLLPSP